MHRFYWAIIFISMASFLVLFIFFAKTFLPAVNQESPKSDNLNLKSEISSPQVNFTDPARGEKNAPNTLVVYGDFLCPYSKESAEIIKKLLADYPERLRIVWKDFPNTTLHPMAILAGQAAHCAAKQNKFWEYHDYLFENQDKISPSSLMEMTDLLGLDRTVFSQCLQNNETKLKVENNLTETRALKLDGTPTIFINGTKYQGRITYENLEAMIQ